MAKQHFRVEIWASQLPWKVSVTCPVNASGSVWQELFFSNLFPAQKKEIVPKPSALQNDKSWQKVTESDRKFSCKSQIYKTSKSVVIWNNPTIYRVQNNKNHLKTNTKSLKNTACMSAWNSTGPLTLDKFNLRWDNRVHITAPCPEFPALPIDGWRWPRSMLVHIIIISLRGEGGNGDQWGSDLPLCAHLLQSQIINWFISPPLPSVLFRGLSEGVHYLFMERSFIQFAGNPIRSSVWMYGEGPQGQVNYSIIFNAWDGQRCQGPRWIYLAL